jgi:hypothetical protein
MHDILVAVLSPSAGLTLLRPIVATAMGMTAKASQPGGAIT